MAVPEEVRKVKRPVNTVVINTGISGPYQYAVRERTGVKYLGTDKNPQPVNGKIIGHIINLTYVPKVSEAAAADCEPPYKSYGMAKLAQMYSQDLLQDLLEIMPAHEAYKLMAAAMVRVVNPYTAFSRVSAHYRNSFVSEFLPGAALSGSTLSKFVRALGCNEKMRLSFYQKRYEAVAADHHIAVDGTIREDSSLADDLNRFSYKGRGEALKDISVLYAYDIELMEPVCSQVFPGNHLDAASFGAFIKTHKIDRGILAADKGFLFRDAEDKFKGGGKLHYMLPMQRNDKRIKAYGLTRYDGILSNVDGVHCKKVQVSDKLFLYAFRDTAEAAKEEKSFMARALLNASYDPQEYERNRPLFGTIFFESDQDLSPDTAYECYDSRWFLEVLFHQYKQDIELSATGDQSGFSLIGQEFINFISVIITGRIIRACKKAGILDNHTYGSLREALNEAQRRTDAPKDAIPKTRDMYWVNTTSESFTFMEKLGICEPQVYPEPKKRGRPRKNPAQAAELTAPKRPRGRPRKEQAESTETAKRPRGRPRIHPELETAAPKRPRGRPRIHPKPDPDMPKQPRGRPHKDGTA